MGKFGNKIRKIPQNWNKNVIIKQVNKAMQLQQVAMVAERKNTI